MSDYQLAPTPRAIVIQLSLRAFVCGLFGVLPVIGLVPGLYAVYCWALIRKRYPTEWNPASDYLSWGAALALVGLAITVVGIPAAILSVALIQLQAGQ
jgi:hypothetical protein